MRRIVLIGPGGAGKSTLAREIAERLALPLIHLDALYWKPGWTETPNDEWRATVATLSSGDAWVMDGNYGGTLDLRLDACDTAIFLDLPSPLCLYRVIARRWRYRGRPRPDMAEGCEEKLDLVFLWWIATYRWRRRAAVLGKLAAVSADGKRVVVLRSSASVRAWMAAL